MTRDRVPPHDIAAEEALLGALLYSQDALNEAVKLLKATDFYKPANRRIFDAALTLWDQGDPVDSITIAGVLDERKQLDAVGGSAALVEIMAQGGVSSSVAKYADRIVRCASWRRFIGLCAEVSELAFEQEADPVELADIVAARLSEVGVPEVGGLPGGLSTVDEFLDRPVERRAPWVVPGMIRVGWRVMLVAAEGVGKTVLFRQIGIAVSQGIHPLNFESIEPKRVLIVDLENPEDSITDVCEPIRVQTLAKVRDEYDADRAWLWHRPGGIDLRSRRDRGDLEAVIAHVRPDLVCLGPIYKAYSVAARESDELAAKEVMGIFDDLRTRYSFALMLEHHAPKGMGKSREMMPYGSSLWLRWPEIGLSLEPETPDGKVMKVGRWRGDRLENAWPIEIERSFPWPWSGTWPTGTFSNARSPQPPRQAPRPPVDDLPPFDPHTGEILEPAAALFTQDPIPY